MGSRPGGRGPPPPQAHVRPPRPPSPHRPPRRNEGGYEGADAATLLTHRPPPPPPGPCFLLRLAASAAAVDRVAWGVRGLGGGGRQSRPFHGSAPGPRARHSEAGLLGMSRAAGCALAPFEPWRHSLSESLARRRRRRWRWRWRRCGRCPPSMEAGLCTPPTYACTVELPPPCKPGCARRKPPGAGGWRRAWGLDS